MANFEIRRSNDSQPSPLLVHIPHSATAVPEPWRSQIILDEPALERELLAMTDRYTDELFAPAALVQGGVAVVNNLSRLIFDPERFEDDSEEVMAAKGMGAVYTRTSEFRPLRATDFSQADRETILRELYHPYAAALEREVAAQLDRFGRCLILDGHSFPSRALPYEDSDLDRPDLCLGYDEHHGPEALIAALEQDASAAGWSVGRNSPFAGSYVPLAHYESSPRVASVMLEVNRSRYMNEETGHRAASFDAASDLLGQLVETAVLFEAFRNTRFHAETPSSELCIQVGECCPELDALLEGKGQERWAYVTAYNPNGRPVSDAENERAQGRLMRELRERALLSYLGRGIADVGDWPPEPSVLILGLPEDQAMDLAVRYRQAAIVAGRKYEPARLLRSR